MTEKKKKSDEEAVVVAQERAFPLLEGIVTQDDVEKKEQGRFEADYVNWARIAHYMRIHAPDWIPEIERTPEGNVVHLDPGGNTGFLMIRFRNGDRVTSSVPHAIMDNRMGAKKNPDARDISDAFVRGMCKAAALHFGLGWELWSKDDPMGRGEGNGDAPSPSKPKAAKTKAKPKTTYRKPDTSDDAEPFKELEDAVTALGKCSNAEEINGWIERMKVTVFSEEDKAVVMKHYKDQIKELGLV